MKIALTGGAGRIGQAIATEALSQGHSIVSIDRTPPDGLKHDNLQAITLDLTEYDQLFVAR